MMFVRNKTLVPVAGGFHSGDVSLYGDARRRV